MSRPMRVDFPVVFESPAAAYTFAGMATQHGFETDVSKHEENDLWDVLCVKEIILNYASVTGIQNWIDELAQPLGGYTDGWGTFGNKHP